jgi:predicted RNA-binding Zn-ribbon protein involved in translation (DUF1610 family)
MGQPCPNCGKRMILDLDTSRIVCSNCNYVRPDEISAIEGLQAELRALGPDPEVQKFFTGEIHPGALEAFYQGHHHLHRRDYAAALESFERSAQFQDNFIDAHLWIAKVSPDETVKRTELGTVLGYQPNNLEALRMLMLLNGQMTAEQVARTYHYDNQQVKNADQPVTVTASAMHCPNCFGDLTVQRDHVTCRFCGYSEQLTGMHTHSDDGSELLSAALLKRKAQSHRWNVGLRIIECQQCGAQQTITSGTMAHRCQFCGSNQIITKDALDSFQQPDGVIPFHIDEAAAQAAVNKQLSSVSERIKNLLNSNKVERGTLQGVYLPFWEFDADIEVLRVKRTSLIEVERQVMIEMSNDILVCGVKSPLPSLTGHLLPYDLEGVEPYEPRWLARFPAEIYSVDFDAASIEAHSIISQSMKVKLGGSVDMPFYNEGGKGVKVSVLSNVRSMDFRLLLLPVWIGTLYEDDGDVRQALVNGQTGKVALGKARKPNKQ